MAVYFRYLAFVVDRLNHGIRFGRQEAKDVGSLTYQFRSSGRGKRHRRRPDGLRGRAGGFPTASTMTASRDHACECTFHSPVLPSWKDIIENRAYDHELLESEVLDQQSWRDCFDLCTVFAEAGIG